MSSSATVSANPFSQWKSTINLDQNKTIASNLPDEVATLIFSKMAIEQVQVIIENTETQMDRYSLYRDLVSAKSSLTGIELGKFQSLLSMEAPVHEEDSQSRVAFLTGLVFSAIQYVTGNNLRPWADLLTNKPMSLSVLKDFDLSSSTNITDGDLIVLTKGCKKLTTLMLPGAFPSEEVMAVLRTNCPRAAIYPTAMTEHEWTHPAEFMKKLPPPPQAIADFINSPRPIWEEKTASEVHMIVPRVNKIVRNIEGRSVMMPWTLDKVNKLDKETGGVGCRFIWDTVLQLANDKPPEVGFEWVVFTKDVLLGSRKQSYAKRKELAEHWGYEMPGFLDAATCMLWENRLSGNRIYGTNPITFTHCKEQVGSWQVVAGAFAQEGMSVLYDDFSDFNNLGVGGLRKFKVI